MIEWQISDAPASPAASCPNCGSAVPRPMVLRASLPSGDWVRLHACPDCGAHAFEGPMAGAYDDMPAGGTDALAFYLQQGANIGGMALRLMALGRPAGTHYLEVGCGFGLSLDFARRMLGWEVLGLDPSPFAREGRAQLGLPIESRFLAADDLDRQSADVIHASEFIEHIADPVAMLATLRQALRLGGTLLLTTPAAEMIRPDTGDGLLVPLLSAGWHLVIHTVGSLEWALRRAGFAAVEVVRHGAQLVAVAGDRAPGPRATVGRQDYVEWLRQLGTAAPTGSDLGLGALSRLYREEVIARSPRADSVWAALDAACLHRFGQPLEAVAGGLAEALPLRVLAGREPLGLAGIALARGWQCRHAGEPGEFWFRAAIAAAIRLRAALGASGADDADAEDVAHAAEAELIRLAAAAGDGTALARVAALRAAGGAIHAEVLLGDVFVGLVNAGGEEAWAAARTMRGDMQAVLAEAPTDAAAAAIVFSAAMLELQLPDGDPEVALALLGGLTVFLLRHPAEMPGMFAQAAQAQHQALRMLAREEAAWEALDAARAAALAAGLEPPAKDAGRRFIHLVNTGALDAARALRPVVHPTLVADPTDRASVSLFFCAANLELQSGDGDWEVALGWLRRVNAFLQPEPASAPDIAWPAAEAEAEALRLLGRESEAWDALDAARAAALAAGLAPPPEDFRRRFVHLVNSGALEAASALRSRVHPLLLDPPADRVAISAMLCAANLELQLSEGDLAAALGWLRAIHASLLRQPSMAPDILWPAAESEADALRRLGREDEAWSRLDEIRAAAVAAGLEPPAEDPRRRFIHLVNGGRLDAAGALRPLVHPSLEASPSDRAAASALFCAANLELQLPDGDGPAALTWLGDLRQAIVATPTLAPDLFWPAVDSELLARHRLTMEGDEAFIAAAREAAAAAGIPERIRP